MNMKYFGSVSIVLALIFFGAPVYADDAAKSGTSNCPAEELCARFKSQIDTCAKKLKSKDCDAFVDTFKKLAPRYDCKRSFDTAPVPAAWLCDEGNGSPGPHERAVGLLSKLKSKKARAFFGSDELRSTLDGDVAEEYLQMSKAASKKKK